MRVGKKLDRKLAEIHDRIEVSRDAELEMQNLFILLFNVLKRHIPNIHTELIRDSAEHLEKAEDPKNIDSMIMLNDGSTSREELEKQIQRCAKAARSAHLWLIDIFENDLPVVKPNKPESP